MFGLYVPVQIPSTDRFAAQFPRTGYFVPFRNVVELRYVSFGGIEGYQTITWTSAHKDFAI